jgi:hypothetical protein
MAKYYHDSILYLQKRLILQVVRKCTQQSASITYQQPLKNLVIYKSFKSCWYWQQLPQCLYTDGSLVPAPSGLHKVGKSLL